MPAPSGSQTQHLRRDLPPLPSLTLMVSELNILLQVFTQSRCAVKQTFVSKPCTKLINTAACKAPAGRCLSDGLLIANSLIMAQG